MASGWVSLPMSSGWKVVCHPSLCWWSPLVKCTIPFSHHESCFEETEAQTGLGFGRRRIANRQQSRYRNSGQRVWVLFHKSVSLQEAHGFSLQLELYKPQRNLAAWEVYPLLLSIVQGRREAISWGNEGAHDNDMERRCRLKCLHLRLGLPLHRCETWGKLPVFSAPCVVFIHPRGFKDYTVKQMHLVSDADTQILALQLTPQSSTTT